MATREHTQLQLPIQGAPLCAAYSSSGCLLVTSSMGLHGSVLQILSAPHTSQQQWDVISEVQVPEAATHLCWAHQEHGWLLAAGTATGTVYVVEAPRPSMQVDSSNSGDSVQQPHSMLDHSDGEEGGTEAEWQVMQTLQASKSSISHVSFAPRQHGLILCAACRDGQVFMWEADRPLAPNSWCLQAKFRAGSSAQGRVGQQQQVPQCGSLCWRPFTAGVPPLLAVGTSTGAELWQHSLQHMSWQRVKVLRHGGDAAPCAAVHWANPLGRPMEHVAVAQGRTVLVWGLQGSNNGLQAEEVAVLPHEEAVWKVEWNMLGSTLAVATEDNQVALYKADLAGTYQQVDVLRGSAETAAQDLHLLGGAMQEDVDVE